MLNIPKQIETDVEEYQGKIKQYKQNSIEPIRFKSFRVPMGVYEQRKKETYMTRVRVPGGIITLEQLEKVAELATKYSHGKVHFTTRQDVQFHEVEIENTGKIMEELLKVGVITRGTGGNTPRNVACSPLSGVDEKEAFDVTNYALETTNYLLKDSTVYNLPRKFKIAYSNSQEDTAYASIADLGFIAEIKEGKKVFAVYGGGGLGGASRTSFLLEEDMDPKDTLYYVQAMKELFENHGDRTNKHKARIRHIVHKIGEEAFKVKYKEYLEKVKKEKNLDLFLKEEVKNKPLGKEAQSKSPILFLQKEKYLYSVYVHPENGTLKIENLNMILSYLRNLDYETSIRLTNTQGFFVRDLKGEDADTLLSLISEFTSSFSIDNSIACAGAATCQLGLCFSQNLLSSIKEKFKNIGEEIKNNLPKVYISGCPNSCGQHQIGKIGFFGKAKRTEKGLIPMYSLSFGGKVEKGSATLGVSAGDLIAKKIPTFLYELAVLKSQSPQTSFEDFVKDNEEVNSLIQQYGDVETFKEEEDMYYDFGSTVRFSLQGRGPGECSVGVMDVITLDLSNASSYLEKFDKTKDSMDLYKAGLSSARSLLILKGVDTQKEREIFEAFTKHFIHTGYVKESIETLIQVFFDFKLGDIESLEEHYEVVKYLVERMKKLHESLNPQLEITLEKEKEAKEQKEENTKGQDKIIDFRNVKCPMNFVKIKIELSKVGPGEILKFYLDDGSPIQNVPKSVEGEGHEIVSMNTDFDGYNLLVIKKKA